MDTIAELDMCYQYIMTRFNELAPDGIREVDLALLQELGILKEDFETRSENSFTKHFQVVETSEKITLYNDSYIVWVVPSMFEETPMTLVLVALNNDCQPHLELTFATSGVYNSSKIILRVLEKFLNEIEETETLLSSFAEKK